MKYKYAAVLLGLMLTISSCPVSAAEDTVETEIGLEEAENEAEAEENTVLGEVTSVQEDSITIAVGEQKELPEDGQTAPEKPSGDAQPSGEAAPIADNQVPDGGSQSPQEDEEALEDDSQLLPGDNHTPDDNTQAPGGMEQPSMLELTGEERTVPVTADTVITRGSMQVPKDQLPEDGTSGQPDGGKPEQDDEESLTPVSDDQNSPEELPDSVEKETELLTLSDIQESDIVSIVLYEDGSAKSITVLSMDMPGVPGGMGGAPDGMGGSPDGMGGAPGGMGGAPDGIDGAPGGMGGAPGGPGQAIGVDGYTAINTYSESTELDGDTISSTGADENAVLIDGDAEVTLKNLHISRDSLESTGGDTSSFYGVGAALLALNGTALVSDSTITTDAAGGAGLFSYGDGTIYAADSTISTQQDTSGGIHAAGGGTLYAWNLNVETNGESSAAIRSDRGGGTMVVNGGTYTSHGVGSPAVYCTADISINQADLSASGSEAVCIEGLNSLRLFDCNLSGNMADDDQNDCTWAVIVYQSMSGDSEVGNSTFQMNGGTLTSGNGGVLYTTNTECTLTLNSVDITYAPDSEFFLRCTGNANHRGWGQTGSNGSDCLFTATNQDMMGDVIWDSISNLDFYMTDGSTLTGAFLDDETYAGNGGNGYCNVAIGPGCTWTVTGDSTVSSLSSEGSILDESGNPVSIVGTDGTTYVEGTSEYTVTTDAYSSTVDLAGATTTDDWSQYSVERPDTL